MVAAKIVILTKISTRGKDESSFGAGAWSIKRAATPRIRKTPSCRFYGPTAGVVDGFRGRT